jgi:hypothetical protein
MNGIYLMSTLDLQRFYYKCINAGAHNTAAACQREMMRRFNKDISKLDNGQAAA